MLRSKTLKTFTLLLMLIGRTTVSVGQAEERIRYDDGPLVMPGAEYLLDGRSWLPRTDLTYGFISTTPDLGAATTKAAVTEAFALWTAVAPLTFAEVSDCGLSFNHVSCVVPDIRVQFAAGNHEDGYPFDGPLGVLAHAFFPPPNGGTAAGDMHFDEAEFWSDDLPASGFDLVTVAAHEIGHALGLAHAQPSKCPDAVTGESSIMCPFYEGPHRFLAQDDIEGIQDIYGPLTCSDDPAEPEFATFANIICHVQTLSDNVSTAGLSTSVTKTLTTRLAAINKRVSKAREACSQGQTKKVTVKLRALPRLLEKFGKQVDKHAAKGDIAAVTAAGFRDAADVILQQIAVKLAAPTVCD
jgi:hypothetical protein